MPVIHKTTMKKILPLTAIILMFNSCAFIFYNYQRVLVTEFSIPNSLNDTLMKQKVGQFIYNHASKEDFYEHYTNESFDSLYFYGPDYHHLRFKITERDDSTRVNFDYFGYHGFRSNPPRADFIQSLTDSLKIKFSATESVLKDVSNEKSKSKPDSNR